MANEIIANEISKRLNDLPSAGNFIVVFKGIPLSAAYENFSAELDAAVAKPFRYFGEIIARRRRIVSYEEFLLFAKEFCSEFDAVYILNNNLYMSHFPIDAKISKTTRENLLRHFDEIADEHELPAEINPGRIAEIYVDVTERGGNMFGVYNSLEIPRDYKITTLELFEATPAEIADAAENPRDSIDITDEVDFANLVTEIIRDKPTEIFARLNNYAGSIDSLNRHLEILQANFSSQTRIYRIRAESPSGAHESRPEYLEILRRHWSADSFREFTIYDIRKLNQGVKATLKISQEQIIANIVAQAENCGRLGNGRDIFVTAPTGAGKSLIFQIPAIYLAERYGLMTIVISPLIALMNDQVSGLEIRDYPHVETINSDISPIRREEIISEIAAGNCHILYISPETFLSRNALEQLIGDRTIGLFVIDEAHIVTTWGRQFRPDYWYLGDQIRRTRDSQIKNKGRAFPIAAFTATAIYGGIEDMFGSTIRSLNMIVDDETSYLGYVRRGDIEIEITPYTKTGERAEHRIDKFDVLCAAVTNADNLRRKTLIYFPGVKLIDRAQSELENFGKTVVIYHGQLDKNRRQDSYKKFGSGEIMTMLATKAFGMGIDVDDIEIVMHFAPTGNVCDYVQEIGRAARRSGLNGAAIYHYSEKDFRYADNLHELSRIKNSQLVRVIEKIYNISQRKRASNLLVDADNFTYIFSGHDDTSASAKVKMALLMIQRDFEFRYGFSPIKVRPLNIYALGLFEIDAISQIFIQSAYGDCLTAVDDSRNIFQIDLKTIWENNFHDRSFPNFKRQLYKNELNFAGEIYPVVEISIERKNSDRKIWGTFKNIIKDCVRTRKYYSSRDLADIFMRNCTCNANRAQEICGMLLASMNIFNRKFRARTTGEILSKNKKGVGYCFAPEIDAYFRWAESNFHTLVAAIKNGRVYVRIDDKKLKAYQIILGIFETLDEISFDMVGGMESQIYIHINQIRNLKYILNHGADYRNKILSEISNRHLISNEMLKYIFEGGFKSAEIWDLLEDYFLGKIPDEVKRACLAKNPHIPFP